MWLKVIQCDAASKFLLHNVWEIAELTDQNIFNLTSSFNSKYFSRNISICFWVTVWLWCLRASCLNRHDKNIRGTNWLLMKPSCIRNGRRTRDASPTIYGDRFHSDLRVLLSPSWVCSGQTEAPTVHRRLYNTAGSAPWPCLHVQIGSSCTHSAPLCGPRSLIRERHSVDEEVFADGKSSAADGKLTLVVGVLEVVVNSGHKFLHKISPDVWHQVFFTLQFTA